MRKASQTTHSLPIFARLPRCRDAPSGVHGVRDFDVLRRGSRHVYNVLTSGILPALQPLLRVVFRLGGGDTHEVRDDVAAHRSHCSATPQHPMRLRAEDVEVPPPPGLKLGLRDRVQRHGRVGSLLLLLSPPVLRDLFLGLSEVRPRVPLLRGRRGRGAGAEVVLELGQQVRGEIRQVPEEPFELTDHWDERRFHSAGRGDRPLERVLGNDRLLELLPFPAVHERRGIEVHLGHEQQGNEHVILHQGRDA
mmetsp:Transcript_105038/g.321911  ORF Transcript_105038/g.321911 Transcript_105038/m.321911 type:complete len:250 (-) Transcript_105038:513-1262(-)